MMKTLIKVMAVVFCLSLSACNYGIFDWNQMNLDQTPGYKKRAECTSSQQAIARKVLGFNYNYEIEQHIFNKCGSNPNYKFQALN